MNKTQNAQILLIEDNESDVLMLKEAFADLNHFEFELVHTERLAEGLEALEDKTFDVVLLDLGLPDSQGVETFTMLHRQWPDVPVLVLTALDDEMVGVKAMKLGAQDYLVKNEVKPPLLARSIRYAIERQRGRLELVQSRQQLRDLAARLQDVREAERTHIAREVHDELGQMLTALKMDLRWIEKRLAQPESAKTVAERVVEAEQLTDRTIETVQRISLELRPSVLDNLGLTEALRDEARRFETRTGIATTMDLPQNLPKLKVATVTTFFRIFQELLTNIARHAEARSVTVILAMNTAYLELAVKDDGKGIPSEAIHHKSSLGLLGMSERAISLGGQINFESTPQRGTSAILRIPIGAT